MATEPEEFVRSIQERTDVLIAELSQKIEDAIKQAIVRRSAEVRVQLESRWSSHKDVIQAALKPYSRWHITLQQNELVLTPPDSI